MLFTENKRRILSLLQKCGPMSLQDFRDGKVLALAQSSSSTMYKWVTQLYERGYVDIVEDKYVITYKGKVSILGSASVTVRTKMDRPVYKTGDGDAKIVYRPGAFDFLKCKSFGVRC